MTGDSAATDDAAPAADEPTGGSEATTIVGRRRVTKPVNPKLVAILSVVYLGLIVWMLSGRRHDYFWLLYSGYLLVPLAQRLRPPTAVSAAGISRPWRRPSMVSWSDVASVKAAELGVYPLRLNLANGKSLSLDDIPATESAAVAALGGKNVQAVKRAVAARGNPDRERNAEQVAADVTRQAEALAEQRRQMAAESRRLRGRD